MKTVVYTAIYGDRDELREIPGDFLPLKREGVSFLCFTDDPGLRSKTWQVVVSPDASEPIVASKSLKVNSHIVPDQDRSIWIDANFRVRGRIWEWFDSFNEDVGVFHHNRRNCIYREIRACQRQRKDNFLNLARVSERYRGLGHSPDAGLYQGGVLLRRNTPCVKDFNELWWEEIYLTTLRDQVSLPYALNKSGVSFHAFERNAWKKKLGLRGHKRYRRRQWSGTNF